MSKAVNSINPGRKRGAANRHLVIGVLCVVVLALIAVLFWTSRGERQAPAPAPVPAPAVAPEPVAQETPPPEAPRRVITGPYAHSPYAEAIEDGLNFAATHDRHHPADWQIWAMLDYLQRKFNLDEKYAIANTAPEEKLDLDNREMAVLFGRMTNPEYHVLREVLDATDSPINRTMARALYCDVYPVDAAFVEETLAVLDRESAPGNKLADYIKTHYILSLHWMVENGCAEAFPQIAAARSRIADILVDIVEKEKGITDLAFEAMAFLYYMGFQDRVSEAWVSQVAAMQLSNGGWVYDPNREGDEAHGHPTVLATWVLLEHALPEAPDIPWVAAPKVAEATGYKASTTEHN